MKYKSQDTLYRLTAKKTGHDEELVKFVISNLFSSVRRSLANPLDCHEGVILTGFINFHIPDRVLKHKYRQAQENDAYDLFKFYSHIKQFRDENKKER